MRKEVSHTVVICDGCGKNDDSALTGRFFHIFEYDFCEKCFPTFINDMVRNGFITDEMVKETLETFEVIPHSKGISLL